MAQTASSSERKYHNTSSAYVLPNDEIEQARLDAQAAAIVEMIGGHPFLTPSTLLPETGNAIDVGCGTGVATIQLANMLPRVKTFGLDITPVPKAVSDIAPQNTHWVEGNILDVADGRLVLPISGDVVFLFGRMLFLGINDWQKYFSIAHGLLKPGGIIEHQDLDWEFYRVGSDESLSKSWAWHKKTLEGVAAAGLSACSGSQAQELMKNAGFEVLSVSTFEFSFVPSSKSPRSQAMGRYVQEKLMPNYPELLRRMLQPIGIKDAQLEVLARDCLRDLSSEAGVHQKYMVTVARKV